MSRIALLLLFRRTLLAIPILLCVSALVFVILRLLPADPVAMSLPPGASAADMEKLRQAFGLDRPLPVQYVIWLGKLATGDLGVSIYFRRSVAELIATALPATLELVAVGLALGVALGVAGGLAMFAWRGRAGEQALDLGAAGLMAIPEFLWAILLILLFGVAWPVMPFIGRLSPDIALPAPLTGFLLLDSLARLRLDVFASALAHLALPAVALAIGVAPLVMRVLRSSLLDVIQEDYVTQARLRGIPERTVVVRHALRNAALPTISLIGVQAGFMFGGTVLVEMIFAYPGLGNLMVDAVRNHDLPVIQAVGLVYCVLVLGINAAVDVLYLAVNPRLRTPA
ncbi:ABC transporter permease [Alsobacter sp. SYSU M60028]|uniref:ABC transporter permease n=1 Tax=Alsobacter ponti TaxID=2962936 RepID=A0ABT1L8W5_9HYPH|nr:ABC transporter permease [Alsobacter ponti]MCP8937945.1 ABC transporter permease [Alsobacter ponti]